MTADIYFPWKDQRLYYALTLSTVAAAARMWNTCIFVKVNKDFIKFHVKVEN